MDDSLPDDLLPELMALAVDAARSASALILSGFRSAALVTESKADGSPVTHFDREAERTIRAFLKAHQPRDWPVLGEEFGLGEGAGGDAQRARYRWVLDPIDGTLAFSRGLPTFGTLLAFEDVTERRSLVGVIHLPAMGETYSAARGAGAWCGDRRIQVSPSRELSDCIISIPAEHHFRVGGIADRHAKFGTRFPHIRSFADCWAHAMVARGSIDAVAEFNLSRWDLAASEIIVAEAGGRVRLRETPHARGKYDCILGSPQAAAAVSEVLGF